MSSPIPGQQARRIVVADEDRRVVELIIETLRREGHAVFHAYDVLAATQLVDALETCDLVLSNTKVADADGVELIVKLRSSHPELPIVYLANNGRSTPEIESQLPSDVVILREPFTTEGLRAVTARMLDGNRPPGGEFKDY